MRVVDVDVEPDPYVVVVGEHALRLVGAAISERTEKVAVVTEASLVELAAPVIRSIEAEGHEIHLVELAGSESSKTWSTVGDVIERLAEAEFHRGDAVVGIGGGAVTDLAGFVAATLLRGIQWFGCSTTILGAVDASIGGKTGVNLSAGKNLAGAFWQPSGVFIDPATFASLSAREIRSGLSEIVKYGFSLAPGIFDDIESWGPTPDVVELASDPDALIDVVTRSIAVKAAVVAADARESTGRRALLNYGHTFGHALERASRFEYAHGEAVAVGMVFAAELAKAIGLIDDDIVDYHRDVIARLGLPISCPSDLAEAAVPLMRHDKKYDGSLKFVLIDAIGSAEVIGDIGDDVVRAVVTKIAD